MSKSQQLGNQIKVLSGFPFPSSSFSDRAKGIPILRIRDLARYEPSIFFNGDYDKNFLIRTGDLLVGMDGDFNIIKWRGPIALLNQRVCKITTKDESILDQDYLYHAIFPEIQAIHRRTAQTTVKHLSIKDLYGIKTAIPPLPKQKKIAEILSGVDNYMSIKKQKVDKERHCASLIASRIMKESDSQEVPLAEFTKLERGKFSHRPRNDPSFYGGDYPFIQTGDIPKNGMVITYHKQTLNSKGLEVSRIFPRGTLVITIAATIGEVGILKYPACFPDSLVGITPKSEKCNLIYLLFALRQLKETLLQMAPQSAQSNLNLEILGRLDVPLPSFEIQSKIADIFSYGVRKSIAGEASIAKLAILKSALASDLLSGRKRVSI